MVPTKQSGNSPVWCGMPIKTNYHKKLTISDKSSPEDIKREFGLSKKAFKRAIGGLLKNRFIEKTEAGFKLTETGKNHK